jgi:hypothetical protein
MHVRQLDRRFRREAEAFFGLSFADVTVLTGAGPAGGSIAACLDETHIWLRDPVNDGPRNQTILIHELCHIAQRRAGRTAARPTPRALLEAQANDAEHLFRDGKSMGPLLPARCAAPLHWGPAGHYYTVYLVALAAGCTPHQSFRFAFFAQIADLVDELDATARGVSFVFNPFESNQAMFNDLWVQKGLHTLTGRPSAKETLVRRAILQKSFTDEFICGLAAHAYGDSYAHRVLENEAVMYAPVAGHAVEWLNGHDPHCPDFLSQRPLLYGAYVSTLYEIYAKVPGAKPAMSQADLIQKCLKIAGTPGDEKQISLLRDCASRSCGATMLSFAPEEQSSLVSWDTFNERWPLIVGKHRLADALTLARQWSNASA